MQTIRKRLMEQMCDGWFNDLLHPSEHDQNGPEDLLNVQKTCQLWDGLMFMLCLGLEGPINVKPL